MIIVESRFLFFRKYLIYIYIRKYLVYIIFLELDLLYLIMFLELGLIRLGIQGRNPTNYGISFLLPSFFSVDVVVYISFCIV